MPSQRISIGFGIYQEKLGYINKFAIISRKNEIYQENIGVYQEISGYINKIVITRATSLSLHLISL